MKITIDLKNINFFAILKYLYPATIAFIIVVLLILIRFLYVNVYETIIQAELITDLRKEISDESLNNQKFDQVIKLINAKTATSTFAIDQAKDPFQDLPKP